MPLVAYADLNPTGRRHQGAASDLVEVEDARGNVYTAVVFHQWYRSARRLDEVIVRHRTFLASPSVVGLAELVDVDVAAGAYVYDTGEYIWTAQEVLSQARHTREPLGVRAGLELAYNTTLVLAEAARVGRQEGLACHGGLEPLRLAIRKDGLPLLIGYGLPQIEVHAYRDNRDPDVLLPDESYQYAPPERVAGEPEDVSSDLYTLVLMAAECMFNEPVLIGSSKEIRAAATAGLADRRLQYRTGRRLPPLVEEVFVTALHLDPLQRYQDPLDFARSVKELLQSPVSKGPSLMEVMVRHDVPVRRRVETPAPVPTSRVSSAPAAPSRTAAPPPRWASPSRSGGRTGMPRTPSPVRPDTGIEREPAPTPPAPAPTRVAAPVTRASRRDAAAGPVASRPSRRSDREHRASVARSSSALPDRPRRRRGSSPEPIGDAPLRDRNNMFPRRDSLGETERYLVSVAGEEARYVRLDPSESLACSAARLVDYLCPTPIDLTGQLSGWYRIVQGDDAWYGDARTEVLDADKPVELEFVPNKVFEARIRLDGTKPVEGTARVGTAVHAQFLTSFLKHEHDLREDDWVIEADGRPLDPFQILDDYAPKDGFELVLCRRRGRHRQR